MNNGFSYYFRNGMSSALHALKGESFGKRFSLLIYFFMSFIGKIFIFTRPIFAIADMNLAAMVKQCQSFSFAKIFQNTADGKRYKNLLLFYFLFDLASLMLLAVMLIPSLVLYILMLYIDPNVYYYSYVAVFYSNIIFSSAMLIGFLLIVLSLAVTYSPVKYISANSRICDISDYLYNAKKGMKGVKWTYFLINLTYFAIILLILGLIGGTVACLLVFGEYYIALIISFIIIITFVVFLIYFVQIFFLGNLNSNYLVYKYTISLDHVTVASEVIDEEDKLVSVLDEETEMSEEIIDTEE